MSGECDICGSYDHVENYHSEEEKKEWYREQIAGREVYEKEKEQRANRAETRVSFAEPNQLSKVCIWRSVEDEYYDTACKRSVYFYDGYLEDRPDYKYCPYCGKEILNEKKQLCEK